MDFILKLFTRCMALAVVFMPFYGIAALSSSVQVQGNVLPHVRVGFEVSTVNEFKAQVDGVKRDSVKKKKYIRRSTVRRLGAGLVKSVMAGVMGYFAYICLAISLACLFWMIVLPSLILLHPAFLFLAFLAVFGCVTLARATEDLGRSAYADFKGREEFVLVPDDCADTDMFYEEAESEHCRF